MTLLKKSAILFLSLTAFTACFNNSWTEDERKTFETTCHQTDSVENLVCLFYGFDNSEFDSVLIKEYKDSTLLDSFKLVVNPAQSPSDIKRKERSATIPKKLSIHNSYHFIIPSQTPYVLDNMNMVMWAHFTMSGEDWGCVMGDYTLDSVRFEHSSNPTFIKRLTK
ncbi:MAG: hypothetical protein V4580_17010 [Bacteroidota bacterium]